VLRAREKFVEETPTVQSFDGEVVRFGTVLSDNVAAQNRRDRQGLFSLRSVTSTLHSDIPLGKFNWNFLLGVILVAGVSAVFWAGVAIVLSGVLR
jgi:hypothetical protein